jgi:hypothetical protein
MRTFRVAFAGLSQDVRVRVARSDDPHTLCTSARSPMVLDGFLGMDLLQRCVLVVERGALTGWCE